MINHYYTSEKNIQQIIFLLKAHGISKIVASPGSSNVSFLASVQNDSFFHIYSVVDERSAAYVACGLSVESKEPVVLSCTGATASRNYIPGLTEAFYRKIPIVAITALVHPGYIGQNRPQVMDRSVVLKDMVRCSVQVDITANEEDEWANNVKINKALLELKRQGGGPVHINMVTTFSSDFSVKELPYCRKIELIQMNSTFPCLDAKRIAIFIGAHKEFSIELTKLIEVFCEKYNAVVFIDHTSNYKGKYSILGNIISNQDNYISNCLRMDILIEIGDISGSYMKLYPSEVWRVNPDGQIRDYRKATRYIFEMEEQFFFTYYDSLEKNCKITTEFFNLCFSEYKKINEKIDDFPLSNLWVAWKMSPQIPPESVIHFAILNSLRSWNYFEYDKTISGYSNTGGFGIDGCLSSFIGASLADLSKLFFCIIGDLAFFYDLNSLGIRHINKNIRILLVNNGNGTEFRNYSCIASQFGDDTKQYISAAYHYGNKSEKLVKNISESLGFDYYGAKTKQQILDILPFFVDKSSEKPIIFEVFTNSAEESEALRIINNLYVVSSQLLKNKTKKVIKNALGDDNIAKIKKLMHKR